MASHAVAEYVLTGNKEKKQDKLALQNTMLSVKYYNFLELKLQSLVLGQNKM
jgi:hypothetical protein